MRRDAYGQLPRNSYPVGWVLGALAPDVPWAVHLADAAGRYWLLCFDFDGKDSQGPDAELLEQAIDQCDHLHKILTEQQIPHAVCRSSDSGARHVWVAIAGGADATVVARVATAARALWSRLDHGMLTNPRTGAARPPLSPHRDGSSSTVLEGSLTDLTAPQATEQNLLDLADTLEALVPVQAPVDAPPRGTVDPEHRTHRTLSSAGAAHMATAGGGHDPSWTGFMCLLAAARAGWSLSDVEHAARTAPGMEHYRTRNTDRGRVPRTQREAASRLARQWNKATEYAARAHRPAPAALDITDLTRTVDVVQHLVDRIHATPGRWGGSEAASSQRAVLLAIAAQALHVGTLTVTAAIRTVALTTARGRSTVAVALKALEEAGYLRRETTAEGTNATEWTLPERLSTETSTVRTHLNENARPPGAVFAQRRVLLNQLDEELLDARHDVFTRAGVGHLAGRIWTALSSGARTVTELLRQLGTSARHLRKRLSLMAAHGLLTIGRAGITRAHPSARDAASVTLGTAGTLQDRQERYEQERELWAWWCTETRTRDTTPRRRPKQTHVTTRTLVFFETPLGERLWPPYPRYPNGRANHAQAREFITDGLIEPLPRTATTRAA
jgi:hypothetical protein